MTGFDADATVGVQDDRPEPLSDCRAGDRTLGADTTCRVVAAGQPWVGLAWLVFHASTIKQLYLGTPLLPSDFWMPSQGATNPGLFSEYIEFTPLTIAVLAGLAVVITRLCSLEPRSFSRRWWIRLPVAVGTCSPEAADFFA